ncbi:hypothetical protein IMSAGC021_01336 [Muribaculaceae bacterium]|nr:hypothetical protein IMSAGC021_01336 [Muribaculaceae bacterium]
MALLPVASDSFLTTSPMRIGDSGPRSFGSVSRSITSACSTFSGRSKVVSHSLRSALLIWGRSARRAVLASAWMAMCALTFLLNSALSMSMCMILACGAYDLITPVTRSSKRIPTARITSALLVAMLGPMLPCIPTMPLLSGCSEGMVESPSSVVATGMSAFSARASRSVSASESITP